MDDYNKTMHSKKFVLEMTKTNTGSMKQISIALFVGCILLIRLLLAEADNDNMAF